jgi:hypothetical protein
MSTKYDHGKARMELLPAAALTQVALVMEFGGRKYGDENWRSPGFKWKRLIGATLRHVYAFIGGEDKDPETGLSHLAHAACCVLFLLEHQTVGLGEDDRHVYPAKEFKNPPLQDDEVFQNYKVKAHNEPTRIYTHAEVSAQQFGMAMGKPDADTIQLRMHSIDRT